MESATNANQLLAGLKDSDRTTISVLLEPAKLIVGDHLEKPNTAIPYVYFVQTGLVSVVAVSKRKQRVEVGLIGNEGMTGISILLGPSSSPHEFMVQGGGSAQRIKTSQLRETMNGSRTLREHFQRYAFVFYTQASHTALANGVGRLEERLARWLLMAHDRLAGDGLALTHEFLSLMLAVRRSGVTVATHLLEGKGSD